MSFLGEREKWLSEDKPADKRWDFKTVTGKAVGKESALVRADGAMSTPCGNPVHFVVALCYCSQICTGSHDPYALLPEEYSTINCLARRSTELQISFSSSKVTPVMTHNDRQRRRTRIWCSPSFPPALLFFIWFGCSFLLPCTPTFANGQLLPSGTCREWLGSLACLFCHPVRPLLYWTPAKFDRNRWEPICPKRGIKSCCISLVFFTPRDYTEYFPQPFHVL